VYLAALDPTKGSEQAGTRPVVIVSRDAINHNSDVVVCVPGSDRANFKRTYPSQMTVNKGSAGLSLDTVFMCEQIRAITVSRLRDRLGVLDAEQLDTLDKHLRIALDPD